jgi:hypothetical protein
MLTGTLDEFALADVFRLVSWAKKTGELAIDRSAGHGKIFFRDGDVYYAESSISREPLGQKLIRSGVLTEGQLMKALDANAQSGARVGQILVDNGWVTEQQLQSALRQQIEDAVFDLLRWELGDFRFEAGVEADIEVQISVSVENLIIEASRRLDELEVIQRKIPSETAVVKMSNKPPEGAAEINITPEEWRMLVLVDGARTVHEIASLVGMDDFGALRALYGLVSAGLVEVVSADAQPSGGGVPVDAFQEAPEEVPQAAPPPLVTETVVSQQPAVPEAQAEPEPEPVAEAQVEPEPEPVAEAGAEPEPEPVAEAPEPAAGEQTFQRFTEPEPSEGGSVFRTEPGGWDDETLSTVFRVEQPEEVAEPEHAAAEVDSGETYEQVEAFDAPGPEDIVETKPDPFLNDLLGGDEPQAVQSPEHSSPEHSSPEHSSPEHSSPEDSSPQDSSSQEEPSGEPEPPAKSPAPPAPSPAGPQVDRSTVVRELAGLFSDDERPPRAHAATSPEGEGQPRRVEDDDALNKGLISRLIDGVKGL